MVDPVMALVLGVGSYGGSVALSLIGTLAARGHRVGSAGRGVSLASGLISPGLAGIAVLAVPDALPMVLAGTVSAGLMGVGVGLLGSELTRMARRALP